MFYTNLPVPLISSPRCQYVPLESPRSPAQTSPHWQWLQSWHFLGGGTSVSVPHIFCLAAIISRKKALYVPKEPYTSQKSLHFAAERKCRADFDERGKQEKKIVPVPRVCLPPRIRFWSLAPFLKAPISPKRALYLRQNRIAEMTFAGEYIFKVIPVPRVPLPPRTRF